MTELHYPIIRCCALTRAIDPIDLNYLDLAIMWIQAHVWFFRILGGLIVLVVLVVAVADLLKIAGRIINSNDYDVK